MASTTAVVVIGVSAGGVEALSRLVAGLPASLPASVLVVLHMPAHGKSQLASILRRHTPLPVHVAQDGVGLLEGHIHVCIPDRHLLVAHGQVRLSRGPKETRARPSVDALFRSAAVAYGPRVIGVVLSGMLDDGTAGLWAIKDRGGIALVQSDADAVHASMPDSAACHVELDGRIPVDELGAAIGKHAVRLSMVPGNVAEPPEHMEIENRIAFEGNGLKAGVMTLGKVSGYTCPECHGVLVEIRDGSIVRFRCHTGHASSIQTLLLDVDDAIDRGLWNALRAVEERVLLLRQMADMATDAGSHELAQVYVRQARETEERGAPLRTLATDGPFPGRDI